MKVRPEQLNDALERGLAPVYLIIGDEPLLVGEAADAVRRAARADGYEDREVFTADRGFDWSTLQEAGDSLSLFATKRVLDVRLPTGKPGDAGGKALRAYAERPAEDTLLLVVASTRLDRGTRNAKWVKMLEQAGVLVEVWNVAPPQLPKWLAGRMRSRGLEPTREAVLLIAERVEGNLLAASQEVEKLLLLCGPGKLDGDDVRRAVADSARYDVFGFVDAVLMGRTRRALRMLDGLRAEGMEPPLLIWALAREFRSLAGMAAECDRGRSVAQVTAKVWQRRKPVVQAALERLDGAGVRELMRRTARLDRIAKGAESGGPARVWREMVDLVLKAAGPEGRRRIA